MRRLNRYLRVALFCRCTIGWLTAQEVAPASDVAASEPKQEEQQIADSSRARFPLDVAGYIGFRAFNSDELEEHHFYREYAGSLFVSKKAGRWLFHS